tara:strand:+ start:550 stop:921 length:372 start_codon:yes stop_codon:yes gene_type:complete
MNLQTGKPDHIEDAIIRIHTGSWFYWTDSKNKIYANLRLHEKVWNSDGTALIDNPVTELPSESAINTKLAELQAAWDLEYNSYKSKRRAEYPDTATQLDDIYHNGIDGWKATVKAIKDKYPKP